MNVLGVSEGRFTTDQVFEAGDDLTTVVHGGMSDSGSVDCEEGTVGERISGRQTEEYNLNEGQPKMEGGHTRRGNRPCRRPHRIRSFH